MLVKTVKTPPQAKRTTGRRRLWPGLAVVGLLVLGGLAISLTMNAIYPDKSWQTILQIGEKMPVIREMAGLGAFSGKRQVIKAYTKDVSRVTDRLTALPKSFLRTSDFPALILDVKFRHLRKLNGQRNAALKRGRRVSGANDFVPAKIGFGGKTHRVRIRLKGDLPDHYDTEKWSFRVKVRRGGHILGMRRFSLQAPKTRQYHGQQLYLDFMRRYGVLAPRYHFVNMWVNGTNIGIMALEEHFSKELVESQGRRDSVMLAFDESLTWDRYGKWAGGRPMASFFKDYTNARIKAFRDRRIARSKQLRANYRVAVGLLRGVVDGSLAPSRAFDVERLGRYLAVAQLWGTRHDIDWYNVRFYFDPITARLEPVAYDAKFEFWDADEWLIEESRPMTLHLLADSAVFESYHKSLKEITAQLLNSDVSPDIAQREKALWLNLAKEFPLLERFPLARLKQRARWLRGLSKAELSLSKDNPVARAEALPKLARPLPPPYSRLVHAYRFAKGKKNYLELRNVMPKAVDVHSIKWVKADGSGSVPFEAGNPISLPMRLAPKTLDVAAEPHLIPYVEPGSKPPLRLMVEMRPAAGGDSVWSEALPYVAVLNKRPVPNASISETISKHPFIRWDAASKRLLVQKGDWRVAGDFIVPKGAKLEVPGGTRLRFEPGRALIAYGPLSFQGDELAPIILEGVSGRWQGVAVLQAKHLSRWSHVQVHGTSGVQRGDWALTGGVTFYQSPVEMESVKLHDHSGEDALNIVSTNFELIDVDIDRTASDAFDSDFSSGRVIRGVYSNIGYKGGGDGIDVSGSSVFIDGVRFEGVSDKALSIGEGSKVEARNVRIRNASTGAATKDGSTLTLTESNISGARVAGLMAYQKKPIFGGAQLDARGVIITGGTAAALAQLGSRITIDGAPITPRTLDVDRLYQTVMRKAGIQ